MKTNDIKKAVIDLIFPILAQEQMELVDVEYRSERGRWILRVFIDRPGGVKLDECAGISHQIGDLIEVENCIPHRYCLEVSSPGLNRLLKNESDFQRFMGKMVKMRMRNALEGRKNFKGNIIQCENGVVVLEDPEGNIFHFQIEDIEKARLEIETPFGSPRK